LEYAILASGVIAVIMLVLVLAKLSGRTGDAERAQRLEHEISALRTELGASIQQTSIALSGLITKSDADMRQDVADRISKGLTDMRDRIEVELKSGRDESAKSVTNTTEAVIKRLNDFGRLTEERILGLEKKTAESLEAIRGKVDERLMAIGEQVRAKLDENIKEGFSHFEKVQEYLKKAELQLVSVTTLGNSVNELNSLLKLPHLRGGFGEVSLELLLAEMPSELYETQAMVVPNARERVDVLIKLPGASLPIDSKFPREQVMPLFEDPDDAKLANARKTLSSVVRGLARDIAAKYIKPEHGTTDMALMYLPSETLYFEVVRDADLWGALQKLKVYPVSPNTFAITLKGMSLSYNYYMMARNLQKTIEDIRKADKHFNHFRERFERVGLELDRAKDAYGKANTHLDRFTSSVGKLNPDEAAMETPDGLDSGDSDLFGTKNLN
jgi:DNA recombination protein RmuC